jgi:hypothetical protein
MISLYNNKGGWQVDMESQKKVYEAQMAHDLVFWKGRTCLLWILVVLLLCGWIHAYDDEARSIQAEIELLHRQGPPTECYFTSNDPEHPIPFTMHIGYLLSHNDPLHTCHVYHMKLQQSLWPSPWMVTVKFVTETFVLPCQHVIHAIAQAPWLVQVMLTFFLCVIVIVCVTARINPIPRNTSHISHWD